MLEDFAEDHAIVDRVTLLCSFSIGKEFKRLPFRTTTMDTIFRTTSPKIATLATTVKYQGASDPEVTQLATPNTWAAAVVSRNKESGGGSLPLQRMVLVNAAGHRVDQQLPQPSQKAVNSWNHKTKKVNMRYCRMYHLNGSCKGGCGYSHGPLLDTEKLVYRLNLRGEVCNTKLKCRDINCHYRHNCSCKNSACKFSREMHGVDETTAEVWEK
ncbi:hypothetical protein GQ44DRAFT_705557 [Phaeosphaeriaceae sp. PMI808]|nr:hypothetical protein GQ44DRAFT_705557 [Phaeosphaeriaceae sp. PMI808]